MKLMDEIWPYKEKVFSPFKPIYFYYLRVRRECFRLKNLCVERICLDFITELKNYYSWLELPGFELGLEFGLILIALVLL